MDEESAGDTALVNLATESYRLIKTFERLSEKLDETDNRRFVNRSTFFRRVLDESLAANGLRLHEPKVNTLFDIGMPVTAVNLEDFADEANLKIDSILEPVVLDASGAIIKSGLVTLKGQNDEIHRDRPGDNE